MTILDCVFVGQKINNSRINNKILFAAADKCKLKMHNKNQDILNCLTGMVGGW